MSLETVYVPIALYFSGILKLSEKKDGTDDTGTKSGKKLLRCLFPIPGHREASFISVEKTFFVA